MLASKPSGAIDYQWNGLGTIAHRPSGPIGLGCSHNCTHGWGISGLGDMSILDPSTWDTSSTAGILAILAYAGVGYLLWKMFTTPVTTYRASERKTPRKKVVRGAGGRWVSVAA